MNSKEEVKKCSSLIFSQLQEKRIGKPKQRSASSSMGWFSILGVALINTDDRLMNTSFKSWLYRTPLFTFTILRMGGKVAPFDSGKPISSPYPSHTHGEQEAKVLLLLTVFCQSSFSLIQNCSKFGFSGKNLQPFVHPDEEHWSGWEGAFILRELNFLWSGIITVYWFLWGSLQQIALFRLLIFLLPPLRGLTQICLWHFITSLSLTYCQYYCFFSVSVWLGMCRNTARSPPPSTT